MTSKEDAFARRIADEMLGKEGTGRNWGIEIEEVRVGYSRIRMTARADMTNGHGTMHGGMIFSFADTALAYACNSRNQASMAANASISFISPAHVGDILIAEAQEEAVVGRSGAYSVSVKRTDGHYIAHFQGRTHTIGGALIATDNEENDDG